MPPTGGADAGKRKRAARPEARWPSVARLFEELAPACGRGAGGTTLAPDAGHVVEQVADMLCVEFGRERAAALLRAAAGRCVPAAGGGGALRVAARQAGATGGSYRGVAGGGGGGCGGDGGGGCGGVAGGGGMESGASTRW